ncbi:hypothetical protein ABZ858_27325 [Streptomyces sp. NPDC047017]|uniref:hypothetical protein n=1 Tax=Streptomyces sp. NPDC047017 TaxID=3155024 RepID=UPI0033C5B7FC
MQKDTSDTAPRECARRAERLRAAEALAERGARGGFGAAAEAHAAAGRAHRAAAR